MKKYRYLLMLVLLVAQSCSKVNKPLPLLTYSDGEPRIQNPLSPEDSKMHIQLPEGFEVSLFASEPNIINPIAFTWDERGRLWVVQSQDYPHGLENEVGGDRITICEDTTGNGQADTFIDFATEQSLTTGITLVNGGAIVSQAPNMVFLEDTDGDDKMDKKTVLFDGFGIWDTHAGPSSLRYGLDNQIWGAVGYAGFENRFKNKAVSFKMGVYRFKKDGSGFEPVGQFNNNTWGLGFNENFEIFGSTANNNHACYVGIPLSYYEYLSAKPKWALNADFIQGHYELKPADTLPLQQVDVRGGFTAAAGANFYTAKNYPKAYRNQMYVNEPTGHLVHIAKIVKDGAGYKEVDGENIFASTDAWTAPVFTETGPDGNLWVADWYNPVIQHNPDKRGMENQIWNDVKGEGNAHLNNNRDKGHGRIYIIKHEDSDESEITNLDVTNDKELIKALQSDNMFWRTTAQRLIVAHKKLTLIPDLIAVANNQNNEDESGLNAGALHALWTLDGLGAFDANKKAQNAVLMALKNTSFAVKRAAIELLPESVVGSEALVQSGLFTDADMALRLAAILKASKMPETNAVYEQIAHLAKDTVNTSDRWLQAAQKIYHHELNYDFVDSAKVILLMPSAQEAKTTWKYTNKKPSENWINADFDDSSWKLGQALFGGKDTPNANTLWSTSDIWLRREFILKEDMEAPVLKIAHDDNYEVYVNGQLLIAEKGSSTYKYLKLNSEKAKLFKNGKNTIAVFCHDQGGERYIDIGIGKIGEMKADVVFNVNTVNQKMAFDKTILHATVGQTVKIVLNNTDQMPHNLVVLTDGSLEIFGERVDAFLKNPEAEANNYVPESRYVLGTIKMLAPGETGSLVFELPDKPGRYPFVCTFPGHWRLMKGVIIVNAPGTFIADDSEAFKIAMMAGGSSHDFVKYFGQMDGEVLSENGKTTVLYTEDSHDLRSLLKTSDALFLCNNKPIDKVTQSLIFNRVAKGMNMFIYHPSIWYNWEDWPMYNKNLVGGGSRSHEALRKFEVEVIQPNHPIMKGVPANFKIVDELYRFEPESDVEIEVLAVGKGLKSGKKYPVIWVVKHTKSKIIANTLGHDERAHSLSAYKTILKNSLQWLKGD